MRQTNIAVIQPLSQYIEQQTSLTWVEDLSALGADLSREESYLPKTASHFLAMSGDTYVVAEQEAKEWRIVACARLIRDTSLTKTTAVIRDVVVRNDKRRRGLAKTLTRYLVKHALDQWGADYVELTSTHRPAAECMYMNMGFKRHDKHRYVLQSPCH
jgi:predicted GNAT family N-acyltransferase